KSPVTMQLMRRGAQGCRGRTVIFPASLGSPQTTISGNIAMRGKIVLLVVSLTLCAGGLLADDVLLGQIYGTGVHSFNQGDFVGAYNALSSAIKGGTNDPRAYYFRGLTYLKLGRDDEAKADFEKGAELEVADSANEFPVNRSLERIQGKPRQVLEYYRLT